MKNYIAFYLIFITKAFIPNIQCMTKEKAQAVGSCTLVSWEQIDNITIQYTLYKRISSKNEWSIIDYRQVDKMVLSNIIQEGASFIDPKTDLQYPDTIELRGHPIYKKITHYILYSKNNVIFNIPSSCSSIDSNRLMNVQSAGNEIKKYLYPGDIFKNIKKVTFHNGWYPEKIGIYKYSSDNLPELEITLTPHHKIFRILKYSALLIILYETCLLIYQKKCDFYGASYYFIHYN